MASTTEQAPGRADGGFGLVTGQTWSIVVTHAVVVLLQGVALVTNWSDDPTGRVLDLVGGVGGVAVLPLLLVRPVPAAVVLGALAALTPAATPTATCAAFVIAQVRPFPVAFAVAAVGAAAHVLRAVWQPVPALSLPWLTLFVVVGYATLVGWGAFVQARRALLLQLRDRAERAEAEQAHRAAEARMLERTRIAREMHDVLAHRLSLVATHAGALEYRPDSPPERLAAAAGVVRAGVHQALDELREVIGVLRDDDGWDPEGVGLEPPQPTLADLPALVAESRAAGMSVDLDHTGVDLDQVPGAAGRTAYRLVQEAMTNARKHAPGQPVRVRLSRTAQGELAVAVANPIPPDLPRPAPLPGGAGLIGLQERVALAHGRLEHGAQDGEFRLRARLPWAG